MKPEASLLPDGQRLHLHHGPIDLIIGAEGPDRKQAFLQATERFQTTLTDLVAELTTLRQRHCGQPFAGPVAMRMAAAVAPFADREFVTPMAAVAGAVAEDILEATIRGRDLTKVYVNNGGDVAFHLTEGQTARAEGPKGPIEISYADPARGVATSGWRGRSLSLGIADAVTVVAKTASMADVAATLIANAINLPNHPSIERKPASDIENDFELNELLVTTDVGPLSRIDVNTALDCGLAYAEDCLERGLIFGAVLALNGETRILSARILCDVAESGEFQRAFPRY